MTLMVVSKVTPYHKLEGSITITTTLVPVPVDSIALMLGSTVPEYRQVEIVNAWKMLWNGVRDRSLMNVQFKGHPINSYVDIGNVSENNRRTSSDLTGLTNNDVQIAIGSTVTNTGGADLGLENSFLKLINYTLENVLKVA